MGNAASDAAEEASMARVGALRDQLADMERAMRHLSARPHVDELRPHQLRVFDCVVDCDADVRVLLGPVVGKVDATSARVLLEVDRSTTLICHTLIHDVRTDAWVEVLQCRVREMTTARQPMVFRILSLLPGRQYRVVFSGLHKDDASVKTGSFRTPTLAAGGSFQFAVVSADDPYDLEYGERSLWRDLKCAVIDEQRVQLVVHLGGQVAMKRMFDKAWAMLVRHGECLAPPVTTASAGGDTSYEATFRNAWALLEGEAMEILRSSYRTQWMLMKDKALVLAHASNLMIWSDWDVYPAFTTSTVFTINHGKPTLEMQVLRTVVRCAKRLFQEYQRALWDDNITVLFERELELRRISEEALSTTARIHFLGHQISLAETDLEHQKKRREIEGARKAERHLRALEAEKVKSEKMLISYNQLIAPQSGEEYFFDLGEVGFLFLDMRSNRVEVGGSQQAENDLLSNVQWASIERTLEDARPRLLFLCSETPIVDDLPHEMRTIPGSAVECDFRTWWGSNSASQQRLLGLLFEWKLQHEGRDVVLFSGSTNTRFSMKTVVRDLRLRTDVVQWMAGPMTAQVYGLTVPTRSGCLFDRFSFEHSKVEATDKSLLYVDTCRTKDDKTDLSSEGGNFCVTRVTSTSVQDSARVLLGPIIGHVDATSAVVLLEVDRLSDLICVTTNLLTGERQRVFQQFKPHHPGSFFINHLRSEHFYEVSFERIQEPNQYQGSFATLANVPGQLRLLAIGPAEGYDFDDNGSGILDSMLTHTLWPWINDNVATGLPFRGVDKVIHFGQGGSSKQEGLLKMLVDESAEQAADHELLKAKIRESQRVEWNMPGVRNMLSRGSHLMLFEPTMSSENDSAEQLVIRECIRAVQLEYSNSLLPPSKRVNSAAQDLENPVYFIFGAFGLFVIPSVITEISMGSEAFWERVDGFLKTPLLSHVTIIFHRPIIEDSVEDSEEKARFDVMYRHTLTFHRDLLRRLLQTFDKWLQRPNPASLSEPRSPRRDVIFLCGHELRSFDSVIRTLQIQQESISSPIKIRQFVVGPLRSSSSLKTDTLRSKVFAQGTLFNRLGYFHRFQHVDNARGDGSLDESANKDGVSTKDGCVHEQLLHLLLSLKPWIDDLTQVDVKPTFVVSRRVITAAPPSASVFEGNDTHLEFQLGVTTGAGTSWSLGSCQPDWLHVVVSQPRNDQEEFMIGEIKAALEEKMADVKMVFDRAELLAKGLVTAENRTKFVVQVCAAVEDFHKNFAGIAFRSKYLCTPSVYVVNYTLEDIETQGSALTGTIDFEQFHILIIRSVQNAVLFNSRLNSFFS